MHVASANLAEPTARSILGRRLGNMYKHKIVLQFTGDNQSVVDLCNSIAVCNVGQAIVQNIFANCPATRVNSSFLPQGSSHLLFSHVPRNHNKAADFLANMAMDSKEDCSTWEASVIDQVVQLLANYDQGLLHCRFDGGFQKKSEQPGIGVRLQLTTFQCNGIAICQDIATISKQVTPINSFNSELEAALAATTLVLKCWTKLCGFVAKK